MKYQTGDLVQLKSGGPPMTVEGQPPGAEGTLKCVWLAGGKLEHGFFFEAMLQPYKEPKSSQT